MPKKYHFLLLFCLLSTHKGFSQLLKGSVPKAELDEVNVLIDNILTDIDTVLILDKNKTFKAKFDLKGPRSGIIILEGEEIEFFIEPQDEILMVLDEKKGAVFSGKNSSNNNFLQAFRRQFDRADVQIGIAQKVKKKTLPPLLNKYLDSLRTAQFNFIDKKKALYDLSEDFLVFLRTEISYQLAKYHSEKPENIFSGDKMLLSPAYRAYLEGYLPASKPKNGENVYLLDYEAAKNGLKGKAKFYRMMQVLQQAIEYDTDQNVQKLFADFKASNTAYPDLTEFLQKKYRGREAIFAGSDAPNFTLNDFSGKPVSLRDFRGKVIYLDFWATNCSPCLKNFQHSNNLREQFKKEEVVFLYVALDDNPETCQQMLKKLQVDGGTHLIDTHAMNSDIAMAYNVKSLPNYVVIDRQGKIFNSQNIAPWETQILGILQKALNKTEK